MSTTKKVIIISALVVLVLAVVIAAVFIAVKKTFKPPELPAAISSSFGEAEALEKVKSLAEVQEFLKTVPKGIVEVDHEDQATDSYVVHVYEIKDGHTATLNWYNVNRKTGEIKKEFEFGETGAGAEGELEAEPTAGPLKTFNSSQYGIEIKYLKDWKLNNETQVFEKGDLVTLEIMGKSQTSQTDFFDGGRLTLALPFKEGKSASDWAKDYYSRQQQKTQYSTEKLGGLDFVKVYTCGDMGCSTYYHTKKGDLIYGIFVFAEGERKSDYQQAISQMLQTLKLTK